MFIDGKVFKDFIEWVDLSNPNADMKDAGLLPDAPLSAIDAYEDYKKIIKAGLYPIRCTQLSNIT